MADSVKQQTGSSRERSGLFRVYFQLCCIFRVGPKSGDLKRKQESNIFGQWTHTEYTSMMHLERFHPGTDVSFKMLFVVTHRWFNTYPGLCFVGRD